MEVLVLEVAKLFRQVLAKLFRQVILKYFYGLSINSKISITDGFQSHRYGDILSILF